MGWIFFFSSENCRCQEEEEEEEEDGCWGSERERAVY